MISPADFATNWANGLQNATQKITAGVQGVRTAPGVSAAQKQQKMRANLLAAIDDGTWAQNTAAVPLTVWQQSMIQKGLANLQNGINAGKSKVQNFAQQLLPFQQNLQAQIDAMPDNTPADAEARMLAWVRGMRGFSYQRT